MSNKGKTMKGVRTVGGKPQQGWDLFFFLLRGGPVQPRQEKAPSASLAQKMELSLWQGRISFHRDRPLNNTGADFSLLAPLPQLVSHCHSLVSQLYQRVKRWGEKQKRKKGRTRRDACGIMWGKLWFVLADGVNQLGGAEFFNKRRTWVWPFNMKHPRFTKCPEGSGWAAKPHTHTHTDRQSIYATVLSSRECEADCVRYMQPKKRQVRVQRMKDH